MATMAMAMEAARNKHILELLLKKVQTHLRRYPCPSLQMKVPLLQRLCGNSQVMEAMDGDIITSFDIVADGDLDILKDFVFVNATMAEASSEGQNKPAPKANMKTGSNFELLFWQSIKDAEDPQMFAAYLEKYPQGTFAPLARLNIDRLKRQSGDNKRADGQKPAVNAAAPAKPPRPDPRAPEHPDRVAA